LFLFLILTLFFIIEQLIIIHYCKASILVDLRLAEIYYKHKCKKELLAECGLGWKIPKEMKNVLHFH